MQNPVATFEVGHHCGNQPVDMVKHSDHVVQARVRCINEDPIGESQLTQAVESLDCWRVKDFKFARRKPLVVVEDRLNSF